MADREEERHDRLPKWAQRRIAHLERDLASAIEKLTAGPDQSDTFAVVWAGDQDRPLGEGTTVRFDLPASDSHPRRYVNVRVEGDKVVVHGSDTFTIVPQSSNVIYVRPRDD